MIEEKGSESIHHDACLIGRIIPLSESDILNRAHCQERGHTRRGALGLASYEAEEVSGQSIAV